MRVSRLTALGMLAALPVFPQGIGRLQPKHGGILFASDAIDAEFVLNPKGVYQLYFTDARGEELPASIVRDLTLSIKRANAAPENIGLRIDESGESWTGTGSP